MWLAMNPGGAHVQAADRNRHAAVDRWVNVLADHNRLLGVAFAKHGGGEVSAEGDEERVAFARAHDAIMAAVHGSRCSLLTK